MPSPEQVAKFIDQWSKVLTSARASFVFANPSFNDSDWLRANNEAHCQFGLPFMLNSNN